MQNFLPFIFNTETTGTTMESSGSFEMINNVEQQDNFGGNDNGSGK